MADEAAIRGLQNYARALMYSARSEKALAISAEATHAAAGVYGAESQGAALAALEHAGILLGAGQTTEAAAACEPALQRCAIAPGHRRRNSCRGWSGSVARAWTSATRRRPGVSHAKT